MATVSLLLLLLFSVVLEAKVASSSRGPYNPSECCFTYVSHTLPRHRIIDYYETSSECPKSGIVFITKKGHPICANPKDEWVQDCIKDLEDS
ncbi:C-C motif chemokine 14 isoform X1 [Marmota flaviventris]|uniref:C-C motif chemokine 14 isoform X1 n=1 Tax=Marmota flaviventris TaxID=93162 RepID=UPI000FFF7341|nr:C-C motif chemokine 14 isoform X1 [Marmota flaviventris]